MNPTGKSDHSVLSVKHVDSTEEKQIFTALNYNKRGYESVKEELIFKKDNRADINNYRPAILLRYRHRGLKPFSVELFALPYAAQKMVQFRWVLTKKLHFIPLMHNFFHVNLIKSNIPYMECYALLD